MKKIILFLSILMFCSSSQAEDLTKKIAETASSYISNLVPGEGTTEVSIDVRENYKPDFSILAVRELERSEDGNYFTQFSLFNTEKNNDERLVGNVGFGKRYLSDDKLSFTGVNLFLDADDNGNKRASIGAEAKNAMLEFTTNYYIGLDDGTDEIVQLRDEETNIVHSYAEEGYIKDDDAELIKKFIDKIKEEIK